MAGGPFGIVVDRDEAETYWQPAPSHGTMNTILSPRNCPSNALSVATQYIDEGCQIRPHAHERIEEILFLYEGHGTLTLEGRAISVREGSTCLVGRYVRHQLDNEAAGTMKVLVVAFPFTEKSTPVNSPLFLASKLLAADTPGCSCVNITKLRPLSGSSRI